MSEHERDLVAAAALGGLSGEDETRLEEEVARNPALGAEADEYRATMSVLESAVAREAPPPDLFDGVLARIEAESGTRPDLGRTRPERSQIRERQLRGRLPSFAAGLAVAAAAFALAFALFGGNDLGTPDAQADVRGTDEFSAVRGEARLFGSNGQEGTLVLDLNDVPAPAAGEHYEVWVLRDSDEGEMEAVGVFSPTEPALELEFRLPGPGSYEAVDVSVEPDGGPAEHSGRSLAGGRFEPST